MRARLLGAFGIVLTVLVLLSSAAYRTTAQNQEATAAVIHAYRVISAANALLTILVDMETGYRGFLLTGDDLFLEPYQAGTRDLDDQVAQLQALTADNPPQVERWRSIETQINEWRQRVTEPGIALRREIGSGRTPAEVMNAWVATGEGRRRFAAIRATFAEALSVEEQLLGERQVEAAAASEQLQIVLVVGTLLALGLGVGLALLLTEDIVRPVARLATTAREIADGHLDRRIGLQRTDEIGQAGAAFDQMTEQLQATILQSHAAEQALDERARELARSNADLEQFAYVASHDLQEPLRAVVSYLQLLERRYGSQLDERAKRYIAYAVDGGRRMQTLISDLLTYSRVGRRDIAFEDVDLEAIVKRVEAGLHVAIEESDAVLTYDPLPTVVGDSTQLTQLFQNLIVNAIKFRGESPPRVHVSAERHDGAWLFSVRDNGIGIAPEYRERVFVLFQRLHARDEYGGTGIGLAVCKKIVERRGGTLWVEDTPGGGSTFRFTIPDTGDDTS